MTALILMLSSLALLAGFLLITRREMRRGKRVFASGRARLDAKVERVVTVLSETDIGGVIAYSVRTIGERIAHDVAHVSLIVVRFVERQLAHSVRSLRAKRVTPTEAGPVSPFASTMKEFKEELRNGRDSSTETPS